MNTKPKTARKIEKEIAVKGAAGAKRKKAVKAKLRQEVKKSPHLTKVKGVNRAKTTYGIK